MARLRGDGLSSGAVHPSGLLLRQGLQKPPVAPEAIQTFDGERSIWNSDHHEWKTVRDQLSRPRFVLLLVSVLMLLFALWGGLLRLGWNLPWLRPTMALTHGPLMVCGFLGTLISLERAVALDRPWAYLAPSLCAIGSIFLADSRLSSLGTLAIFLGSMALILIFVEILRRQFAIFTLTMGLGAVAWSIGNLLWLGGTAIPDMVHWWIGFFVLTIIGERLELSRFLSPSLRGKRFFLFAVLIFFCGLILASVIPIFGEQLTGVGMICMAVWLLRFDIARRTIKQKGLSRFSALCLLGGYAWLGAGGVFWLLAGIWSSQYRVALLHYDIMLHSIFIGFVFSMIFAHAPIIFPAVTGRPLGFRPLFYSHVGLLHLSLLARIGGDLAGSYSLYIWGGLFNVVAILVFVANSGYGILLGARKANKEKALS